MEEIKEITKSGERQFATFDSLIQLFAGKLIEPPLTEIGLLLKDIVRSWRFRNQINILTKAKTILQEKGISPKAVPLKILVPLLEVGSLEDDASLQDKWATLLANYADPTYEGTLHPSYIDILKQLSPFEVHLLDKIFTHLSALSQPNKTTVTFSKEKLLQAEKLTSENFDIETDNLFRLNLIQPPAIQGGDLVTTYPMATRTYDAFNITALGYNFILACRRN